MGENRQQKETRPLRISGIVWKSTIKLLKYHSNYSSNVCDLINLKAGIFSYRVTPLKIAAFVGI